MLSDEFLQEALNQDIRFSGFSESKGVDNPLYRQLHRLLQGQPTYCKEYLDVLPMGDAHDVMEWIESILTGILMETRNQRPGFLSVVSGYLTRLLALLADPAFYEVRQVALKGSREDYIFNNIQRCLKTSHGRVDYDDLEAKLHYTRDYLNRIVRRRTGLSLVELDGT